MHTVNNKGLIEIRNILSEHHKLGGKHFTDEMICAWARDVERNLDDGNGPDFEILATDSTTGHTETFSLDESCYD